MNENVKIDDFLKKFLSGDYKRQPLAGDASFRRYERIITPNCNYMLMIAPPEVEDVRPFIKIDEILLQSGLNAPDILEKDVDAGLLLLEDFGDDSYTKIIKAGANELELYQTAISALDRLPKSADVAQYNQQKLIQEVSLFTDWFATEANKDEYLSIWNKLFEKLDWQDKILVLRDYHADNLMWLPERDGLNKVGILDFQDALMGHPAYDVVSLLQDARRDVKKETVDAILANKSEDFMANYQILGAQRNLKIIGIFNRLQKRDGKDSYLRFLPRVWGHLRTNLEHPELAELREWIEKGFANELAA